ncbi:hypothetical protein BGZ75_008831, partial [Mortierella antarctica]
GLRPHMANPNVLSSPFAQPGTPMVSSTPEAAFPSVQELSLILSADIEIHRLWKSVTEILSQHFHATRITLCLPQDPTVVASSIENNLHQSRPWGLKAHWDYKYHFLDENTVTPKDEFAHQHHRLHKTTASLDNAAHQNRLSGSALTVPSSSSSSFSSSSSASSSFSRRRAAQASNDFSISLTSSDSNSNNSNNSNNSSNINRRSSANSGGGNIDGSNHDHNDVYSTEGRNHVPIPDSKTSEYHEDYWSTHPPLDGGYSSSASSVSSYSSSTGNSAMHGLRSSSQLRGFSVHSSGTECFANLQSLEYDPEPLLNERTIDSILKAGKTVVLTREYVGPSKSDRRRSAKLRSFLNHNRDDDDDNGNDSYTDTDPADTEDHMDVGEVEVSLDIERAENKERRTTKKAVARTNRDKAGSSSFEQEHEQDAGSGSYFPPIESNLSENLAQSFVAAQSKAGYADFVQGLNPTWSQSPAPSPNIIKEDPTINPFFFQPLTSYPTMDDDAFDPPDPTPDSTEDGHSSASEQQKDFDARPRSTLRPLLASSVSQTPQLQQSFTIANARSLIHVPLYRSSDHNFQRYMPTDIRNNRPPAMPVGIISFLSDQIPYPPEALDIVTELNPFLANQVTNALRLEDMVARSKRWGDIGSISNSGLGDTHRSIESFAESIQRKMKDTSDVRTPKPSTPLQDQYARSKQQSNRHSSDSSRDKFAAKTNSNTQSQPAKRLSVGKNGRSADQVGRYESRETVARERPGSVVTEKDKGEAQTDISEASTPNDTQFNAFTLQSPDPERFYSTSAPSSMKQPETCYNLDSTTDEIHRSLNLLNLDITGSATCPLAPQTKKMLGKHHGSKGTAQSHKAGNGDRRKTESALTQLGLEESEGADGMWQTLQPEPTESSSTSRPNSRSADKEIDAATQESPYTGSVHSVSPSNSSHKRHLFSTNKRSGVRRSRKSIKEHSRPQYSQLHPEESPVSSSPYTPATPAFPSHPSDGSSLGVPGYNAPALFSPEPSPLASPTARHPGMFDQKFIVKDMGLHLESGSFLKDHERAPLSRHGSGWSFNSDDTSLASPSLLHEKNHHAVSIDRKFDMAKPEGIAVHWAPVRDCGGTIVHWFGTSTDIHDQKLAEIQLNRQVELELNEKKYRLLAEAIPQIVFTASPHIGLTFANAKWFTYSGQVFEQASGLGFMDHVHPEDRAKCFLPTHLSEGTGSPPAAADSETGYKQSTSPGVAFGQGLGEVSYQTEMRLLRKDGKYRWFLVKCISVEVVEQGRKWFGTCTDINDQKLLEHKLKEAHDAAQKSTESKTRFLSNMSHEIRTPLVGITGMINFLITTDLTSEQLDYVHTVQQSADALLLVINDILDLSKVEAGMMKLEMEPFSVHAMIEGANELLSTLAIQKGLELGFLVEDEVPEVVIGDRVRLRQVLINIIGNAIKFTSHGEVFSRCSLVSAKPSPEPDMLTIKFEISDTGKGFDEAERAVMFKPFSQVDASSTRKHGGTGLGLVLSKEFVELHGGRIACESVKGEGSKFSFTFVARVPPPNVTARATTPIASDEVRVSGLMRTATSSSNNTSSTYSSNKVAVPLTSNTANVAAPIAATASKPPLPANPSTPPKSSPLKEVMKRQSEPVLLRHVTGLKLIPGELCIPEPDFEDTKKTATEAFMVASKKIERGEFATADTTLETAADNTQDDFMPVDKDSTMEAAGAEQSPPGELCTAMTRTESILDERRYLKVGQLTPTNPPMGEPPYVAIIAANLPNPAMDMKLAIPASKKVAAAASAAAAAAAAAAVVAGGVSSLQNRPDMPLSQDSSSSSSSSISTISSLGSRLTDSTAMSSSGSLNLPGGMATPNSSVDTLGSDQRAKAPEQARILVVADFLHARETIVHLVRQLVPKELNPLMDVATDLKQGIEFLVGGRKQATLTSGQKYNYVVINLAEYMSVMDIFSVLQQDGVLVEKNVMTCVITTPIQRAALMEAVKVEEAAMEFNQVSTAQTIVKVIPSKVEWVFKPLTKSKLYVAFADIVAHQESLLSPNGYGDGGFDGAGMAGGGGGPGSGNGHGGNGHGGNGHDGAKGGLNGSKVSVKRRTAQQVVTSQKEIFSQMHDAMEGKNIRILLAEDDLTNQKVIRRYFQMVGADLTIANDGNECLDKFQSHPRGHFSLILCDLFMPGKDGYEATRAIRKWEDEQLKEDEKRIPIVALSANVMANVAEQCLNSGFTSYLSKPVDFKKLSDTLRKLVL